MNLLTDVPWQYRAGYILRECEYTFNETEYFYSLDNDSPLFEEARQQVLDKRHEFFEIWITESEMLHFYDECATKSPAVKDSTWKKFVDYLYMRD